ncbi:MAG TPA: preprotein translocase subunit SecG [Thermomicrobiales bacterium]|nr:preprotein translocase subunit SecG [Thermomicrobiales bacterium]
MDTALNLVMIIISIVLTLLILLQTKGSQFSGAFGGDTSSIYKTRRGIEKTLFEFTIGVAAVFVVIAIVSTLVL